MVISRWASQKILWNEYLFKNNLEIKSLLLNMSRLLFSLTFQWITFAYFWSSLGFPLSSETFLQRFQLLWLPISSFSSIQKDPWVLLDSQLLCCHLEIGYTQKSRPPIKFTLFSFSRRSESWVVCFSISETKVGFFF